MKNRILASYETIGKLILVTVALGLGLIAGLELVPACPADERIVNKGNPVPENIGFMKNPPKELTDKFPMCDAFLKVEWIDKEKKIGYSNYEIIIKGEKKMMWALVTLKGDIPSYAWDVYQFKRQGRMKEIFEMLKYGEDKGDIDVLIPMYKGKSVKIYPTVMVLDEGSLADRRCTVCVPYPDSQRVWIVEGKSIKQTYSQTERRELSDRIKETAERPFDPEKNQWLESLWILDVNFDGKEDFVFRDSFVVTWSNKLYSGNRVFIDDDVGFQYTFPPNGRSCRVKSLKNPLTTDGTNYYIANQCNLTELTSR